MAWWIFQSLVTTAALAALVAVVCRFGRIGPVARHALWVLVLVKFVMPPLVVWPWAAPDPLGLARLQEVREAQTAVVAGGVNDDAMASADESGGVADAPGLKPRPTLPENAPSHRATPAALASSISPWTFFALVWIAGSLGLSVLEVVRQVRLARRVRRAGTPDPSIVRRVDELASELGVPPVPVVSMPGSTSPAVWCLGRPRLLWPEALRTDSQACIDGVIVHELAHIKRRDHVIGWIELVAGLVWWWNPLFWSVRRALREQAELACDAWVISALPDGRRAYAESLLALSSPGAPRPPAVAAVMGVRASSRRVLERRLVMIMNGRASLRLPWAGFLTLALLAAATLPAWATGTGDDSQHATQAAKPTQTTKPTQPAQEKPKPVEKSDVVKHVTVVPHVVKVPNQTHTVTIKPSPLKHEVVVRSVEGTPHFTFAMQKPELVFRDWKAVPTDQKFTFFAKTAALTEEGQKLVNDYSTDVEAIQKEIDAKLEARRQESIKKLEALQDQYTKAGKLDEAVAIRDYLRAGGPGHHGLWSPVIRKK